MSKNKKKRPTHSPHEASKMKGFRARAGWSTTARRKKPKKGK